MSFVAAEIESQPDMLAACGTLAHTPEGCECPPAGRCSSRGRRVRHVAVHGAVVCRAARECWPRRDGRLPSVGVPALALVRPRRRDDAIRDNHRGDPAAGGVAGPHSTVAHNRRPRPPRSSRARRSRWTSPTSGRWCRPASPRPRSRCGVRIWARTSMRRSTDARRELSRKLPAGSSGAISSPSSATAGPSAWPTRRHSSYERRLGRGPRPIRRWSSGTGRSASWTSGRRCGYSVRPRPDWSMRSPQPARSSSSQTVDPMADLVSAQRLAVAVAERKGLDPDAPRHLTRSIVLADR